MLGYNGMFIRAASILLIMSIFSRVLGLFREATIAGYFGASAYTDAFFVAFRIPDFLFNSLVNFLVATSFIPIFSKYLTEKDRIQASSLASNLLNIMVLILTVLVITLEIFAPVIISFIAPGLNNNAFSLSVQLTRIMIPIMIFGGLTGLFKSVLNTIQCYTIPALIPVIYNLCIISIIILLAPTHGIYALAIGVLLASIFQCIMHIPKLLNENIIYHYKFNIIDQGIKEIGTLIYPVIIALFLGQAVPFFEIYLASSISPGAISYLNYANRIFSLPEQMYTLIIHQYYFHICHPY